MLYLTTAGAKDLLRHSPDIMINLFQGERLVAQEPLADFVALTPEQKKSWLKVQEMTGRSSLVVVVDNIALEVGQVRCT